MKTLSLDMLHHFNPFPLTHGFTDRRKTQFGEEESHEKHILRALRGGRICDRLAFNNLDRENACVPEHKKQFRFNSDRNKSSSESSAV